MGWAGAPERHWMLLRQPWPGARRVCGCVRCPGWGWPAAHGLPAGRLPCLTSRRHDGQVAAARGVVVGCLLYLAFCLSTARLLAGTPPQQTAQSEQRQDTDMTADLLRTGWGRLLLLLV